MADRSGRNVLALFEDTGTAHDAVVALERSGNGAEIKVFGADEPTALQTVQADVHMVHDVARRSGARGR